MDANNASTDLIIPLVVAYLCGCAVRQEVPNASCLQNLDVDEVMSFAEGHSLASCVGTALETAGFGNKRTKEEVARGMWRVAQLQADWEPVRQELEREGIWYCPLKGAVIKDLYPAYGMRQMADFDVLFDASRASDVRRIMEDRGYFCQKYDRGVHDVYLKKPVTNFEMHRELFGRHTSERIVTFYQHLKDRLIKDDDNAFGWHMSKEDCYLYVVAHEYKHYSDFGIGLRPLLDVYVYLCAYGPELDWEWIIGSAHRMGMGEFEESNRELALRLFGNEELTEADKRMLSYMAESNAYGTLGNSAKNRIRDAGGGLVGRMHYFWASLFPPHETLKNSYPVFYEHKVLLPFLLPYRLLLAMTTKRNRAAIKIGALLSSDDDAQ